MHDHHLLGLAILLIPTLILLANELLLEEEATPDPEPGPTLRSRIGAIPRRYIVGTAVLILLLIWLAGTNSSGMLLGLGVVFVGTALFLWYRDRAILRGVRRELDRPRSPGPGLPPPQPSLEARLHLRPVVVDHRVPRRVAPLAAADEHVLAEDALERRPAARRAPDVSARSSPPS